MMSLDLLCFAKKFPTKTVAAKAVLCEMADACGMATHYTFSLKDLASVLNANEQVLISLIKELEGQGIFTTDFSMNQYGDEQVSITWFARSAWMPCPPETIENYHTRELVS